MIVAAAVNINGKIYTGRRHGDAIRAAIKAGEKLSEMTQKMQGFVAETGEFVSRIDARVIAVECSQLHFYEDREGKPLVSEELW